MPCCCSPSVNQRRNIGADLNKPTVPAAAALGGSGDSLNSRVIQPQVPKVVVLAKDNLAVSARDRIPKYVSITTALKYRDGHTKVGYLFATGVVAKHLGNPISAESKDPGHQK